MPAKSVHLALGGLHCASCVQRVQTALRQVPGVDGTTVNLADRSAEVRGQPEPNDLIKAVESVGFKAWLMQDTRDSLELQERITRQELLWKSARTVLGLVFGAMLLMHMPHKASLSLDWDQTRIYWLRLSLETGMVMLIVGWHYYLGAWKALQTRSATMDTLISLGTLSSYFYSLAVVLIPGFFPADARHLYLDAAIMIVSLVNLGSVLETRARRNAQTAIRKLVELQPDEATLIQEQGESLVSMQQIRPGDVLLIRPGERIPVDGTVQEGQLHIDESLLTGEYRPVLKSIGAQLHAGSYNLAGSARMTVTGIGESTTLAEIIRRVREAQNARPPIASQVDRWANIFVPIVLSIALITLLAWLSFGPAPRLTHALVATVSVLIIACPCALGLAVPMSIMMASDLASRHGILIRDGEALQTASRLTVLFFDKTGTLTEGRGSLNIVHRLGSYEEASLISWAAAIEQNSEHAFAQAVVRRARRDNLPIPACLSFASFAGLGVSGIVEGHRILLGTASYLNQHQIMTDAAGNTLSQWSEEGISPILMAVDGTLEAILGITDTVRIDARKTLGRLHQLDIQTMLLSGDHERTTAHLAHELGVQQFWGGCSPEEKLRILHEQQVRGEIVGMVGDGINDAPALAAADVGIALGHGTDIAMAASGITLTNERLDNLILAIRISRATLRNIRQNLLAAFLYNMIAIPFAAGVFYHWTGWQLNPMLAAGAMAASSLTVVLNASRLRFIHI